MDPIDELNENLVESFDRMSSWEQSVIQQGKLNVAGAHAIEKLGQFGSMSMKDLSKALGVTTGTTTITVDRLENGGYAVRERADNDRRSYIIRLTEKGNDAYLDHHRHHLSFAKEIASFLTDEEIECFTAVLEKITREI
ncbi:MAG: MarR family transcriptional regulator [Methanomicrobium sp.]|nr:MarR family transcriptional regulator [Methanomicrobium sp.]